MQKQMLHLGWTLLAWIVNQEEHHVSLLLPSPFHTLNAVSTPRSQRTNRHALPLSPADAPHAVAANDGVSALAQPQLLHHQLHTRKLVGPAPAAGQSQQRRIV